MIPPRISGSRRFSMFFWFSCCLGFCLELHGCAVAVAPSNIVQAPDYKSRSKAVHTVLVAVPHVRIVRGVIGGDLQELTDDDARVAGQLAELVSAAFSQAGFQAKATLLSKTDRERLQSTYDLITYQQSAAEMHPTLVDRHSLGSEIAPLASDTETDGIVLTRFEGYARSSGSVAAGMVASALMIAIIPTLSGGTLLWIPNKTSNGAALLEVVLADGKTGDVLWEDAETEDWGMTLPSFDQQELSSLMAKVFATLPQ